MLARIALAPRALGEENRHTATGSGALARVLLLRGSHMPVRILFAAILLHASAASAGDYTYCVGGFSDGGFVNRSACNAPAVVAKHFLWHFHTYVTDGTLCYECWDERDVTCETGFLREPQWSGRFRSADLFECGRLGHAGETTIFRMVEQGSVTAENTTVSTPPGKPVALSTEIVRMSPGPHAAGDTVEVVVRVVGGGTARPVQGAEVVMRAADGTTTKQTGTVGPDGLARVSVVLPQGGDVELTATATGVTLAADERLDGTVKPASTKVQVSPCQYRMKLVAPASGSVVVAGAPLAWRAELEDLSGQPASASAIGGGTAVLRVDGFDGQPLTGRGTGLSGSVALAEAPEERALTLSLGVEGTTNVCGAAPVRVTYSPLGVAIDSAPLPVRCYVGLPCDLNVALTLAEDPRVRPQAEQFANDPTLAGTWSVAGEASTALSRAQGGLAGSFVPTAPGDPSLEIVVTSDGRKVASTRPLAVRWPLQLAKPPVVDLGTHDAGTPWSEACGAIDFSSSKGIEEQELELTAQMPSGCEASLVVPSNGLRAPLAGGVTLTLGADRKVPVCLETARCGGDESPEGVRIRIVPKEAAFAKQALDVDVRYRVIGTTWFGCHGWWLMTLLGLVLVGAVGYGFIVPIPFSNDDTIRVASKEPALRRAVARRLRDLPGGRSGWYRSGRIFLGSDGSALSNARGAILVLEAGRGHVRVAQVRGSLQRLSPRTRTFEPVETGPHELSKNAVYEVAGMFFQVS